MFNFVLKKTEIKSKKNLILSIIWSRHLGIIHVRCNNFYVWRGSFWKHKKTTTGDGNFQFVNRPQLNCGLQEESFFVHFLCP